MPGYLLIESRDPFESSSHFMDLARSLAQEGKERPVTLFLVENGVLPARKCEASQALSALAKAGVEVLADEFSLRERGIGRERLVPEVKPVTLEAALDRIVEGRKTLWH